MFLVQINIVVIPQPPCLPDVIPCHFLIWKNEENHESNEDKVIKRDEIGTKNNVSELCWGLKIQKTFWLDDVREYK